MNVMYQHLINKEIEKYLRRKQPGKVSSRDVRRIRVTISHNLQDALLIMAGVFSAGFGLKGFLLPNSFIDGGVTGISLLLAKVTAFSLPVLIVLINAPFIGLGYRQIGKGFALKSVAAILGLATVVALVEYPIVTSDKLLVSVFGGFFLGAGIGLAVRGGAVLDGTEVLAVWMNRRTGLSIGDVILLFNIVIFSFAAWLLSVETALYSILIYLSASRTVDFIVEGVEEYIGVTIISPHYEDIREMLILQMGRGVTLFSGKGGFGKKGEHWRNQEIIFTVLTRLELAKMKKEVEKIDPNAFLVMTSVQDIKGGMAKRRPLKH